MTALAFKDACYSFAKTAAPYLLIEDEKHYKEALQLIESLLEKALTFSFNWRGQQQSILVISLRT